MYPQPPLRPHLGTALRALGALLTASLHAADAGAVFINFPMANPLQLRLRVGSSGNKVDVVTFPNISGANISPAPSAVTYTPLVEVELSLQRRQADSPNNVVLTVNSSAGMACQSVGCGSTVIPFSEVCWVSTNKDSGGGDIQNGCFTGSASQQLASFGWVEPYSRRMYNTLQFSFQNSRVYPAGSYSGMVTYTATVP